MQTFAPQNIATLNDLAFRVAAQGVDCDRAAVAQVARRAERLGASSVLTDVVLDPREPGVARQRAFGQLLTLLAREPRTPQGTEPDTSRQGHAWPAHAA
jgi:hypothetical protein